MSVKYKVQLPDHDFVIATKHKLTPFVIGLRKFQDTPLANKTAVKYSEPTVILVKSVKHTPSNVSVQIEATTTTLLTLILENIELYMK